MTIGMVFLTVLMAVIVWWLFRQTIHVQPWQAAAAPEAGDDATRSFETKRLQHVHNPQTVADGARTASMSDLTFRLMLQHVSGMVTVDDRPLLNAMFYLWERLKLLVEPTGALGAAAAFEKTSSIAGKRVGVILTGGNVDLSAVDEWRRIAGSIATVAGNA